MLDLWLPLCQTSHTPEEQEHSLGEGLEVVVSVDVRAVHHGNLSKHLRKKFFPFDYNFNNT